MQPRLRQQHRQHNPRMGRPRPRRTSGAPGGGPTIGYEPDAGFTNHGNTTMSMIVAEQQGRIFAGTFVFGNGNNTESISFSGVIGRDGKTLTLLQKTGGYSFGEITSPGEIELISVDDGTHYTSSIDMLKKA
ncbi:hypothetical protein [Methanoregula formicica]|uniref:hypothetical protein n=1 Tax=Methanoregula formicica TaxID=882104 RepID=UPI0011D1A189|nr:hypothetical protein [Methanoregula formicica]